MLVEELGSGSVAFRCSLDHTVEGRACDAQRVHAARIPSMTSSLLHFNLFCVSLSAAELLYPNSCVLQFPERITSLLNFQDKLEMTHQRLRPAVSRSFQNRRKPPTQQPRVSPLHCRLQAGISTCCFLSVHRRSTEAAAEDPGEPPAACARAGLSCRCVSLPST